MADLRLDSSDGEYLLLSLPSGETHRLVIDEALRKAVRRESFSVDESNLISPREIQLEVRAGVSIEDLVSKTGASLEYIQKFAAPVIDELAHVVKSALSVRLTMAGDRYSETTQVEFGDVIANRLASQGVVNYSWSARKSDNGGWQIHCRYDDMQATWAFDPRRLSLSPENELAVSLSTQQSLTDAPVPRLRSVVDSVTTSEPLSGATATLTAPTVEKVQTLESVVVLEAAAEVVDKSEETTSVEAPSAAPKVAPIWDKTVEEADLPKPRQQAQADRIAPVTSITADLGKTVEFDGVVPFGRSTGDVTESPADGAESLANTADLLDALRRRRLEREQEVLAANTGSIDLVDFSEAETSDFDGVDEPAPETAPLALVDELEPEAVEPEKPKKSARPSMPSWDEIVFNNRNDD